MNVRFLMIFALFIYIQIRGALNKIYVNENISFDRDSYYRNIFNISLVYACFIIFETLCK